MNSSSPLALYVHLPFCSVHCSYCPFAVSTDLGEEDRYVAALVSEIERRATGGPVSSLYFGGGTPSRTGTRNLARIVATLRDRFAVAGNTEFSLEANPEDVSVESIAEWVALGVNRLSIGVQSFNDRELRAIGRVHDADRARRAIADAGRSGIRASLDLIAGLPEQSHETFAATLEEAAKSGVGHVSVYMLDLDERTPLQVQVARGRTRIPEDEEIAAMYLSAVERLTRAGLQQYEISNFARPGEESRHNRAYWQRVAYLGFGLAAHSFLEEQRFANTRNLRVYIEQGGAAEEFREVLGPAEQKREAIFLGLRQSAGLDYRRLVEMSGQEGIEWVGQGLREGWLRRDDDRVAFTPAGFILSSEYISRLF